MRFRIVGIGMKNWYVLVALVVVAYGARDRQVLGITRFLWVLALRGDVLDVSEPTVKRDLRSARAWLASTLDAGA